MTTTPLTPTSTLTPEPPPDIRVRDLIEMLQREDPDAHVQVVTRVADEPDAPLDDDGDEYEAIKGAFEDVLATHLVDELTAKAMSNLRELGCVLGGREGGVSTDEVEHRYCEGIERRYDGKKVVVVR